MSAHDMHLLLYGFLVGWNGAVLTWLITQYPRRTAEEKTERAARKAARRAESINVAPTSDEEPAR